VLVVIHRQGRTFVRLLLAHDISNVGRFAALFPRGRLLANTPSKPTPKAQFFIRMLEFEPSRGARSPLERTLGVIWTLDVARRPCDRECQLSYPYVAWFRLRWVQGAAVAVVTPTETLTNVFASFVALTAGRMRMDTVTVFPLALGTGGAASSTFAGVQFVRSVDP
jgi:hypothetical protein